MARWGRRGFGYYCSKLFSELFPVRKNVSIPRWRKSSAFQVASYRPIRAKPRSIMTKGGSSAKRLSVKINEMPTRKRSSWRKRMIVFLVLLLVMALPTFIFMERNLREPLMHVAKIRIKQIATQAINKAVTAQVTERSLSEQLIDWKMDSSGKVSGFMLNYNEHMRITASTIETVERTLLDLHHVPEKIPIGHALDSAIISNYGPKIPVTFEPLGAVKVELNTREKNAAINMVLVEVYIKVITEVAIVIPFDTEPEVVEAEIPISYLLVVGDVPMYYYDSTGKAIGESAPQAPNISVPLDKNFGISSSSSSMDEAHTQ